MYDEYLTYNNMLKEKKDFFEIFQEEIEKLKIEEKKFREKERTPGRFVERFLAWIAENGKQLVGLVLLIQVFVIGITLGDYFLYVDEKQANLIRVPLFIITFVGSIFLFNNSQKKVKN